MIYNKIDVKSDYDKIDLDNLFMLIHEENLVKYFTQYNCKNVEELEDFLWTNFGVSIKVI
jgi:hypothetical protein